MSMTAVKTSRLLTWYRLPVALQESVAFRLLPFEAQGVLFSLWKSYWTGGCEGLPSELNSLQKVTGIQRKFLKKHYGNLLKFFEKKDEFLRCEWLDGEHAEALEYSKRQQDKVNKRYLGKQNNDDTPVDTPVDTAVLPVLRSVGSDPIPISVPLISGVQRSNSSVPAMAFVQDAARRCQANNPHPEKEMTLNPIERDEAARFERLWPGSEALRQKEREAWMRCRVKFGEQIFNETEMKLIDKRQSGGCKDERRYFLSTARQLFEAKHLSSSREERQ